jgi:peroxiredoxin
LFIGERMEKYWNVRTVLFVIACCVAELQLPIWASRLYSDTHKEAIDFTMPDLSRLTGRQRRQTLTRVAMQIRHLPASAEKVVIATELADSATQGDLGAKGLQEVTTTLSDALTESPSAYSAPYEQLARLVHYDRMKSSLNHPKLALAMSTLKSEDEDLGAADFNLSDLHGGKWTRHELIGRTVLVTFWQAGCPPCVNEIPALNAVYDRFRRRGLIVLAITDDEPSTVRRFLGTHAMAYPILLDSDRKVTERFNVVAIPRTIIYDRAGLLADQAVGARTKKQLTDMLGKAGLY